MSQSPTALLLALVIYSAWHVIVFGINVYRGQYPQVIKLGLVALGAWAAWLLVAG